MHLETWELITSLCPQSCHKFITAHHATFTSKSWKNAITHFRPTQDKRRQLLSLALMSRSGPSAIASLINESKEIEDKLKSYYSFVPWNPFPINLLFGAHSSLKDNKIMTCLSNGNAIVPYFGQVKERAGEMYKAKAYLHWYDGTIDKIESSFDSLDSLIQSYSL